MTDAATVTDTGADAGATPPDTGTTDPGVAGGTPAAADAVPPATGGGADAANDGGEPAAGDDGTDEGDSPMNGSVRPKIPTPTKASKFPKARN